MHILSYANRFYYDELEPDIRKLIKVDVELYSSMLRTSFKMWYDHTIKNVSFPKDEDGREIPLQTIIKDRYGTTVKYGPCENRSSVNDSTDLIESLMSFLEK